MSNQTPVDSHEINIETTQGQAKPAASSSKCCCISVIVIVVVIILSVVIAVIVVYAQKGSDGSSGNPGLIIKASMVKFSIQSSESAQGLANITSGDRNYTINFTCLAESSSTNSLSFYLFIDSITIGNGNKSEEVTLTGLPYESLMNVSQITDSANASIPIMKFGITNSSMNSLILPVNIPPLYSKILMKAVTDNLDKIMEGFVSPQSALNVTAKTNSTKNFGDSTQTGKLVIAKNRASTLIKYNNDNQTLVPLLNKLFDGMQKSVYNASGNSPITNAANTTNSTTKNGTRLLAEAALVQNSSMLSIWGTNIVYDLSVNNNSASGNWSNLWKEQQYTLKVNRSNDNTNGIGLIFKDNGDPASYESGGFFCTISNINLASIPQLQNSSSPLLNNATTNFTGTGRVSVYNSLANTYDIGVTADFIATGTSLVTFNCSNTSCSADGTFIANPINVTFKSYSKIKKISLGGSASLNQTGFQGNWSIPKTEDVNPISQTNLSQATIGSTITQKISYKF